MQTNRARGRSPHQPHFAWRYEHGKEESSKKENDEEESNKEEKEIVTPVARTQHESRHSLAAFFAHIQYSFRGELCPNVAAKETLERDSSGRIPTTEIMLGAAPDCQ